MLNMPQLAYPCALPHKQLLAEGCEDIYSKMLPIIVQTYYFGTIYRKATKPIEKKKTDFLLKINHFLEIPMHLNLEVVTVEEEIFIVDLTPNVEVEKALRSKVSAVRYFTWLKIFTTTEPVTLPIQQGNEFKLRLVLNLGLRALLRVNFHDITWKDRFRENPSRNLGPRI